MGQYKGLGGCVWEITPPAEGTQQRKRFDAQVASGELVEVEAPKRPTKVKEAPAEDV